MEFVFSVLGRCGIRVAMSLCRCLAVLLIAPTLAGAASVRLVDKSGAVSNVGLVQVQAAGGEYGAVCGMDAWGS